MKNILKNKKRTKYDSLSYKQFMDLMDSMNKNKNINCELEHINYSTESIRYFQGIDPAFVSRIVKNNFKPMKNDDYFIASYEVISSKKEDNHYIELEAGKKETQNKKINKKTRASLEWIVDKSD